MTTSLIHESVFAAQFGIPRKSFTKWRISKLLVEGQHYQIDLDTRAYLLTEKGETEAMRLAGIESPPAAPSRVPVSVQCAGVMPRILRCKQENGVICSVRLTGPRVFASQFRKRDKIEVLPTEHSGIFEYDGQRPKRIRI